MKTRTVTLLSMLALGSAAVMADIDRNGPRFGNGNRGSHESREARDARDTTATPNSREGRESGGHWRGGSPRHEPRNIPAAPVETRPSESRHAPPRFVPRDDRGDRQRPDGNRFDGRGGGGDRGNVRGNDHRHEGRDGYRGNWRNDNWRHDNRGSRDHRPNNRYNDRYVYGNSRYGYAGGDRHSHRHSHRDHRGRDWYYAPSWYQSYRSHYFRFDSGRYYSRNRFSIGIYLAPRGYSVRAWRIGQYLPYTYYDRSRYELHDYWRFNLYDPPYWACWIRVGDDALLVDSDTGEVIDAVYDLFY